MIPTLESLKIKIFADGADLKTMGNLYDIFVIKGFTTNPSLMRKDGVTDYEQWARKVLRVCPGLPVSFEVLADDLDGMERQARKISAWGKNVYVKIPITNTEGASTGPIIRRLSCDGIKLNVTGLTTFGQVVDAGSALSYANAADAIVSVFAGRIADTGRDPAGVLASAALALRSLPNVELLWASTRELLNIFQADAVGCHIITVTPDILRKLPLVGKDLSEYSLETVRMFRDDAVKAGYTL
jgi:transaldolase